MPSPDNPRSLFEKNPKDIKVTTLDGQVQWRPVYEDGTVGNYANTGIEGNNPEALKRFLEAKRKELGIKITG